MNGAKRCDSFPMSGFLVSDKRGNCKRAWSRAALKAFAEEPTRFDLVLTDEMMPELTGTALALEIHRIRSDIPILIMSGYVNSVDNGAARAAGVNEVLRKPLQSRDIAEALARVLTANSPLHQ